MNIIKFSNRFFRIRRKYKKFKKRYIHEQIICSNNVNTLHRRNLIFNSSNKPLVSIIIPFYNEEVYTWNCLFSLHKFLETSIPFEILLIDDNSTDEYDFSLTQGVKLIKNKENLGFLKNINKGIKQSVGEYIYILNNDTEVQKNFLSELFFVFNNFENVGAVGSKLFNADGSMQEAGSLFTKNYSIGQIGGDKKSFHPEINYVRKVDYCSGCSLLFKKHDDNGNLNLFDEQFAPAYFEETDFCFNLKYLQNKNIYYTPFSKVLHYNGVSYNSEKNTNKDKQKKKEELFRTNKEKFYNKWNKQIDAITAIGVKNRILEIYNNKSIVFFCTGIPEYDKDSGSNRVNEIIDAFIKLDYHVTLITGFLFLGESNYIEYYLRKGVNVVYRYTKHDGFEKHLLDYNNSTSIAWIYGADASDIYLRTINKKMPNAKIVYDMVDIYHLRFKRAFELNPKDKSNHKNHLKYKKIELQSSKLADIIIAVSDDENVYMQSFCPKKNIITISNIHYPKVKKEQIPPFEERKDILFIGSMHPPNLDAVRFLYTEIMPIVWKSLPELNVNIIGNIKDISHEFSHPNFIFKGYVPDITPYFTNNKLMVAPLRYGAGVKGKIGQSFEYYLPVVTTSIGAEGMKLINYGNALISDTNEGFADYIIELYLNKELWNKLKANSSMSIEPFSREKLNEQLIILINQIQII